MGSLAIMKNLDPEPQTRMSLRLLIPVDATDESRWGLQYALRLAQSGLQIEVCLLFVAEPARNWEVLRFYTEDEVQRHFVERSEVFLGAAAKVLRNAGVACRTFFREADVVSGVIDMAEELDCSEIVVPRMHWLGIFPTGLGQKLVSRHCSIPVTLINADGGTDA